MNQFDIIRAFIRAIVAALKSRSPLAANDTPEVTELHALLEEGHGGVDATATEGQPLSADEHAFIRKLIGHLGSQPSVDLGPLPVVHPLSSEEPSSASSAEVAAEWESPSSAEGYEVVSDESSSSSSESSSSQSVSE